MYLLRKDYVCLRRNYNEINMDKEPKNSEILKAINDFSTSVDKRFDAVDERFEKIDERFEKIDERFEKIDERLNSMDKRMAHIETDVSEIRKTYVDPQEFEDLVARVKYLEIRMGVESGK